MELRDAVALVTGASSGIGRATAQRLAAAGATVLLAGRDENALHKAAGETGGQVIVCDLCTSDGPLTLAQQAIEATGRVDVLVNNAGIGWAGAADEIDASDIERLLAVNLTAPLLLTRALLPGMLARRRGHVVMVTSIAGRTGVAGEAVYAASKGGLTTFADSLRLEVGQRGVGVTSVAPGVIDTAFFDRRNRPYERRWPRPITADRVAEAIVTGIRQNRADVYVPAWLVLPARLAGAAPAVYRALASRFG